MASLNRPARRNQLLLASFAVAGVAGLLPLGLWLYSMTGDGKPQPRPFSLECRPHDSSLTLWIITNTESWPSNLVVQRVSLNGESDAPVAIFYSRVPRPDPNRKPPISLGPGDDIYFLQKDALYPKKVDFIDVYTNRGKFRCDPNEKPARSVP